MIRTVRSIEEEARVRLVSGPGMDAFLVDPGLTDAVEGGVVDDLVAWGTDGVRRALVVGLEDRGSLALRLAKAGVFVTIVEPDETLLEPVRMAADAAKCSLRMNLYASDYMHREFAASGFDLAVFLSALSRYNEPVVVMKKAGRELRAGGKVFARVRVRPPLPAVPQRLASFEWTGRVMAEAGRLAATIPGLSAWLALPDAEAFLASTSEVFKLEKVERRHVFAPALAWAAVALGDRGRAFLPLVPRARTLDDAVLRFGPAKAIATHLVVYGLKELGLGKTFRV
jgi:SAM-dependent methyltransferase